MSEATVRADRIWSFDNGFIGAIFSAVGTNIKHDSLHYALNYFHAKDKVRGFVAWWFALTTKTRKHKAGCVLFWNFFSAYLCVPLRLCGKCARTTCLPQRRRGTQRYAEKVRHHHKICATVGGNLQCLSPRSVVSLVNSTIFQPATTGRLHAAKQDARRSSSPDHLAGNVFQPVFGHSN